MKNLSDIYKHVVLFNAQRYERVYNHDLAIALLREEYNEYLDAETEVDQLDALCDIIYVAMGVIWKLNISDDDNNQSITATREDLTKLLDANSMMPQYLLSAALESTAHDSDFPVLYGMHLIIGCCLCAMQTLNLTFDTAIEALLVVCASNASKTVQKTRTDEKANLDKGPYFVRPEPELQSILDRRVLN